jgi:hypothetical protein
MTITPVENGRKFKLTQREVNSFVGVIDFHKGPRGGRFRSIRTELCRTLDEAIEATEKLASRTWGRRSGQVVAVRDTDVCQVDSLGREVVVSE